MAGRSATSVCVSAAKAGKDTAQRFPLFVPKTVGLRVRVAGVKHGKNVFPTQHLKIITWHYVIENISQLSEINSFQMLITFFVRGKI